MAMSNLVTSSDLNLQFIIYIFLNSLISSKDHETQTSFESNGSIPTQLADGNKPLKILILYSFGLMSIFLILHAI